MGNRGNNKKKKVRFWENRKKIQNKTFLRRSSIQYIIENVKNYEKIDISEKINISEMLNPSIMARWREEHLYNTT